MGSFGRREFSDGIVVAGGEVVDEHVLGLLGFMELLEVGDFD